jgi:hypothetical protein
VSIRKTEALQEAVLEAKRLPYPIIIKHGTPPHYTILQLDRDLRDRGRLDTKDYFDLTESTQEILSLDKSEVKEKLEEISEEISNIQRKIWSILDQ